MGSLSPVHLVILLAALALLALVVLGVYWLIRLAVRHGTRDGR